MDQEQDQGRDPDRERERDPDREQDEDRSGPREPFDDEDDDPEPPWPGWRALASGRSAGIALVVLIVAGFWAFSMAREQARYNAPSNTQTVCVPLGGDATGSGDAPVTLPSEICVTSHG